MTTKLTINLDKLNAEQLAALYWMVTEQDDKDTVYDAGTANAGIDDFDSEVKKAITGLGRM